MEFVVSTVQDEELTAGLSDVLSEVRTLLTVAGLLFAFLLNSLFFANFKDPAQDYLLLASVFSSLITIMVFAMPVFYHHVQFPYKDKKKFILRSHSFILLGLALFFVTLFLTLVIAFYNKLGVWSFAFALATFVVLAVVYKERSKIFFLEEKIISKKI